MQSLHKRLGIYIDSDYCFTIPFCLKLLYYNKYDLSSMASNIMANNFSEIADNFIEFILVLSRHFSRVNIRNVIARL